MTRVGVLLLGLSLAGCEIETHSRPRPAYPPPPPPGAPGGPPPPGPAPAPAPPPPSAAPGACPAGRACFTVVATGPGPLGAGRLVVMWVPPTDDVKVTPEVGYSAPLPAGARSTEIPLSAIRTPSFAGSFPQCWGYVFVVPVNEPALPSPKRAVGVAQMMFVHARNAAAQAPYMKEKFPAGVAEGTAPYFMQKGQGSHDNFLLAKPGAVFTLSLCPQTAPNCDLPSPNPS